MTVEKGSRFVFPFQGEPMLWEARDDLGDNRWRCEIVNGTFMGWVYNTMYKGLEAAFDTDHIKACMAMDDQLSRVFNPRGKMSSWQKNPARSGCSDTETISSSRGAKIG